MKYLLLSIAKFLSLAVLSSLFLSLGQAQESYSLHYSDGSIFGILNYEDSSFLSILDNVQVWSPHDRFAWSRFSEQGDSIVFHSSPFANLSKYSLWEAQTFDFYEFAERQSLCFTESIKWRANSESFELKPVSSKVDTGSYVYVRINLNAFTTYDCSSLSGERLPIDRVELLFGHGDVQILPCVKYEGSPFLREGGCYSCRFNHSKAKRPWTEVKAIRFKGEEILPWFYLNSHKYFIELVYLETERTGSFSNFYLRNEHFYVMDGKVGQRLDDSIWLFESRKLTLKAIGEDFKYRYFRGLCAFKYRPDDPAFNFKVLDVLPRGCTDEMRQYSPHLEPEQPTKARPKPKRRVRQRRLR